MFLSQEEIQDFYFQINISPNIVFNYIQSINNQFNSHSIRINYIINENDEILFHNVNEAFDNFYNFLIYEILIIKIDFIKNISKMIIIYNNENKEYNIRIWTSKLEKTSIKDEYNIIIKNICSKNCSNNILKKILQLKPEKYTIYYFPLNISLFEQELVFIYIYYIIQTEKSKFQNFRQIKDLIYYSKSFLLNKINDFIDKYENRILQNEDNKQMTYNQNLRILFNNNKENELRHNFIRNNDYISPKNLEIEINFNKNKFSKIIKKSKKNNLKKNINYMRKPYNKIVFNYSFEKNDKNKNVNKVKNLRDSFNSSTNKINSIIIDTYKCKDKDNNFISIPKYKIRKLNNNILNKSINYFPFSYSPNNNNNSFPYEKKRPNSIKNKNNHHVSSNNGKIRNQNIKNENNNNQNSFSTFNNNSISYRSRKILYKRKNLSKNKNKEGIDSYNYIKKINYINTKKISNSTYDNIYNHFTYNNKIYSNILTKNRQENTFINNISFLSNNPLAKTFDNDENNLSIIPITKKSNLNLNNYNYRSNTNLNNGNKTSRNYMNNKIKKQYVYKHNIKLFNKTKLNKFNKFKNLNDNEEEISLFL